MNGRTSIIWADFFQPFIWCEWWKSAERMKLEMWMTSLQHKLSRTDGYQGTAMTQLLRLHKYLQLNRHWLRISQFSTDSLIHRPNKSILNEYYWCSSWWFIFGIDKCCYLHRPHTQRNRIPTHIFFLMRKINCIEAVLHWKSKRTSIDFSPKNTIFLQIDDVNLEFWHFISNRLKTNESHFQVHLIQIKMQIVIGML